MVDNNINHDYIGVWGRAETRSIQKIRFPEMPQTIS
jgi:hypothetical protein